MKKQAGSVKSVLLAIIFVFAIIFAIVFGAYSYVNGLRTTTLSYETGLNAQYLSCQNYLSAYVSGFYEQLGIANLKSEKLNAILIDAAKGKYDGGVQTKNALFVAITEAAPDVKGLDIFDKIVDYISSRREGYRAIQDKLLDMLRSYDFWRQDGYIQSLIVERFIGAPTKRLVARIGTETLEGPAAIEKMYLIILVQQAKEIYQKGTIEPLSVKP